MSQCRDLGLLEKVFLLIGVGPPASAKAARWIRANVPGVHIPDSVIARLGGAQNQRREGKNICIELIQKIREIEGVSGVHIMAFRQEHLIAEIVEATGILDGRIPWYPDRDKDMASSDPIL